ncbi:MAG: FtsX-like permease family protein [Anaerolineae bacterium]
MILSNLLRRKGRTLLTVLGISIGVAAIVGLGALARGLEVGYGAMMEGSQADLVLSQPGTFDVSYSSVDEAIAADLAAMPEVKAVCGMLEGIVPAESNPYFFVFGYPSDAFMLGRFRVTEGVELDVRDTGRGRGKPLLLGAAAAETMNKRAGDTLRLMDSTYRVVGIYQTGNAFEDSGAVLGLADAQALLGKARQVSLFYIRLEDPGLRDRLQARVERLWPDLSLGSTGDLTDKQQMGDMTQAFVWAIAGLAIVIGGVGMMNAQLMSVFERTREIGVLRAVGWSSGRVLGLILGESILVCLAGGALGIVLGWLSVAAVSSAISLMGATTANISPDLLAQALGVVAVLGLVGGLYPAWRASRLQPVEALSYEGGGSGSARRLPLGGMATQSLWRRTTRTFITLAAIGLTVGAIIVLEAEVRGLSASMGAIASNKDVEIMVRQADISDTSLSALDERTGDKIAAMPEVASVSGVIFTAFTLPESSGFFILQGYEPRGQPIRHFTIVEGEPLAGNRQIILGRLMAEALHRGVGDALTLGGRRLTVVGIYETGVGWEELGGVTTLRDAQAFAGRPRMVTMYGVKLLDPAQAEAVVDKINAAFPDTHAALTGDFAEQTPDMRTSNQMLNGTSVLAIAVGGVGVMNTMLMSVLERTREIGVLRALGWRRRRVLGLILREAALLGTVGGLAAIVVALALAAAIQAVPGYGSALTPVWQWDVFARAIGIALVLGLVGGFYPALRATRMAPVEALRYE